LLEHLSFQDGQAFLAEAYRILKDGGRLRIATPDLGKLLRLKASCLSEVELKYIAWCTPEYAQPYLLNNPCFAINRMFYNWGHHFIYDQQMLRNALCNAGFREITLCRVGHSVDANCCNLEHHQTEIGEEFNELETMVFEGVRAPTAAESAIRAERVP